MTPETQNKIGAYLRRCAEHALNEEFEVVTTDMVRDVLRAALNEPQQSTTTIRLGSATFTAHVQPITRDERAWQPWVPCQTVPDRFGPHDVVEIETRRGERTTGDFRSFMWSRIPSLPSSEIVRFRLIERALPAGFVMWNPIWGSMPTGLHPGDMVEVVTSLGLQEADTADSWHWEPNPGYPEHEIIGYRLVCPAEQRVPPQIPIDFTLWDADDWTGFSYPEDMPTDQLVEVIFTNGEHGEGEVGDFDWSGDGPDRGYMIVAYRRIGDHALVPRADTWIAYDYNATECPVPRDTPVRVRLANEEQNQHFRRAADYNWNSVELGQRDPNSVITSYQIRYNEWIEWQPIGRYPEFADYSQVYVRLRNDEIGHRDSVVYYMWDHDDDDDSDIVEFMLIPPQ